MSGTIRGLDYGLVNEFTSDPYSITGPYIQIQDGTRVLYHAIYMEPRIRDDDRKHAVAVATLKRLARNKLRRQSN